MYPRLQLIDMILEFDAPLALNGDEVEPAVREEGIFDPREIIHAILRRYWARVISLRYETMREDDIPLAGMDVRRELLVDLNRLALRSNTYGQEGEYRDSVDRLHSTFPLDQ